MKLKPREGLTIIDPDLKTVLPAEGREVPETPYWHRRLIDGDVVVVETPVLEDVTHDDAI